MFSSLQFNQPLLPSEEELDRVVNDLDPQYVTGFSDGESNFSVSVFPRSRSEIG